jgi:hypothetical protein
MGDLFLGYDPIKPNQTLPIHELSLAIPPAQQVGFESTKRYT